MLSEDTVDLDVNADKKNFLPVTKRKLDTMNKRIKKINGKLPSPDLPAK